jgi:hypothetical protein
MPYANPAAAAAYANPAATVAHEMGAASYYTQLGGALLGGIGPPLNAQQLAQGQALHTAGLAYGELGTGIANQEATSGFTIAQAILGEEGYGLKGQTLAAQIAAGGQQQGIEQEQYGITAQKYPQEQAEAALTYKNKQLGLQRGAAGSGTLNTQGSKEAQTTAKQQYAWQSATIFRQQQLAQLGQQSEQIGYGLSGEQLANAQRELALTSQRQGLGLQQSMQQLTYGLSQLGIQATPTKFYAAAQNATGAEATLYRGALGQASLLGGLSPTTGAKT